MQINETKSYTEYTTTEPTTDFVVGFEYFNNKSIDTVNITVDNTDAASAGYTVSKVNDSVFRLTPAVPSGKTVRLVRETDLDAPIYKFSEGALFRAPNVDANFKQVLHSQQEVRDGFSKLSGDTYAIIDTLQVVGEAAQGAADAAKEAAQFANDAAAQVNDKVSQSELSSALQPISKDITTVKRYTPLPYIMGKNYEVGERVTLSTGEIVENLVSNNNVNPNTDMLGWVKTNSASQILDESGKTQQQINNNTYSLLLTSAVPFVSFADAMDVAPILKTLANSMPEGATLHIPKGDWAIKSNCTITKNINIKSDGRLVVSGDSNAVVRIARDPAYTLSGSDLSQLPKKGDTKLFLTNTTLFDSSEYFFTLSSTEVEIVRIGYTDPYYKNETLDFIDSDFNLRGQIDLDYTDASKLTIYVYKKQLPVSIELNMSMIPNSGQTSGIKILECAGVNNITWDLFIDRSTSKNVAGISFLYTRCVYFSFTPRCKIAGGQSDINDSYAFLNIASSYITHFGVNYNDSGNTSKRERGYAARHGKYVYFDTCFLNGIDDHYGHHYTIYNMDFHNRGIGISGGYVTIENCNQYNVAEPLYFLRTDTPYCDGELRIINCSAKVLLALTCVNNSAYSAKFKMFDRVTLRDINAYISNSHFINIGSFFSRNTNFQSESLEITNVRVYRTGSGRFISDSSEDVRFKRVEVNNFRVLSDLVKSQIIAGLVADKILLNTCSEIDGYMFAKEINIIDTKHGYHSTAGNTICATEKLILNNSEIVNDGGIYSTKPTQGEIYLYNSRINSWRFFAVAEFANKVVVSNGTTSNVSNPINFDLFSFNKLALDRVATTTKTVGTLGVGLATSISQVSVSGARIGDVIHAEITTVSANGLRVNAWVSANNVVKYYIENPAVNPNGSQTITSVDLKFTVKSI